MKEPRHYIEEIQHNLRKLQSQGAVTPTENALFGTIDGLAGLQLITMERVARLEQMLGNQRGSNAINGETFVPTDRTEVVEPGQPAH